MFYHTSLHCELAHALCCPLQAIHSVIFVVAGRHWDTLAWLGNISYTEQCKETDVLFMQRKSRLLSSEFYALVIRCSLPWKLLFGVPSYIPQIYTN